MVAPGDCILPVSTVVQIFFLSKEEPNGMWGIVSAWNDEKRYEIKVSLGSYHVKPENLRV